MKAVQCIVYILSKVWSFILVVELLEVLFADK